MLIRSIQLENFGLYAGSHTFDLTPRVKYRKERPIILFGGKNGAGKTTLLEAVRLALYGRSSLGARVRQTDYDAYLLGRIHRARGSHSTPSDASVGVEFDYVREGNCTTYLVRRSWRSVGRNGNIREAFRLLEDGKAVADLPSELAEEFARDIVPEGLSQLFFFDGEKIRELAEDSSGDEVLADSVKALLGLDTVERLAADLTIYSSRKTGELADRNAQVKLAKLSDELDALRRDEQEAVDEIASTRTKIEGVEAEVRREEERLRREGQSLARDRDRLRSLQGELKAQVGAREGELRELCEGLFPFALCPSTAETLRQQIEAESAAAQMGHVSSAMQRARTELLAKLTGLRKVKGAKTKSAQQIAEAALQTVDEYFASVSDPQSDDEGRPSRSLLNLSEADSRAILAQFDAASGQVAPKVRELCNRLEHDFREQEETARRLEQIPSDSVTAPIVEALRGLHERLGGLRQMLQQQEEARGGITLRIADTERKKHRLEESIGRECRDRSALDLVRRTRLALDDYLAELTKRKIGDLRQSVVECFNRLARKEDVISDISIDPDTFAVTLYDRHGTAIPKSELSSGEKQIYAISMLWGLARTSGRPLPIIIDTPLGRLDSEHRKNLCERYFPHASHQVIILSTDTEIDQTLFRSLSPDVSRCYQLHYDDSNGSTSVSEGYFWREDATNV